MQSAIDDLKKALEGTDIGEVKAKHEALSAASQKLGAALYARLPRAQAEEADAHIPLGPSRWTIYKLAALFSLDSFAGGFAVQSLMAAFIGPLLMSSKTRFITGVGIM